MTFDQLAIWYLDQDPVKELASYYIIEKKLEIFNSFYVFVYNNKPSKAFTRSLTSACKDAGITYGRFVEGGFIFHDLRHTINTNMKKAGVDESVIMAITGHSTREMFDRYNTVDRQDIKKATDFYSAFVSK
jgi:integrase